MKVSILKKYPDILKIRIYEKKPIAILIDKKKKYYLSEKIKLIEFINLPISENLPYVLGNKDEFKILHENMVKLTSRLTKLKNILYTKPIDGI